MVSSSPTSFPSSSSSSESSRRRSRNLPPQEAQNHFQMVFRRFLGVFPRARAPALALFLDDLQWLDSATLDLLEHLVTHSEVRHLLLIGAYRDSEVGPSHPLVRTLESIREDDARVHGDRAGAAWASATLAGSSPPPCTASPSYVRPLAYSSYSKKTGGNPVLYAIQFLIRVGRRGPARVRIRRGRVGLGHRSYRRQGLHRQRGGSHGPETEAVVADIAGHSEAARLPRQHGRDWHASLDVI